MFNLYSRQRLALFGKLYTENTVTPAYRLLEEDGAVRVPSSSHFLKVHRKAIDGLLQQGILR